MKFAGIDPRDLDRRITIKKEIPPGTATSQLETLSGSTGEIVVGRTIQQGEYVAQINIAGKTPEQGMELLGQLAAWAQPTAETTAELIPSKRPAIAYDAIFKEMSPPEFFRGFTTVDVVFAVPRPIAHSIAWSHADDGASRVGVTFGGTHHARPELWLAIHDDLGEDLLIRIDDKPLIKIKYDFEPEQVLKIYTDTGAVTVNGTHREDLIDFTATDFGAFARMCTPGRHVVQSTGAVNTALRWRDEWV